MGDQPRKRDAAGRIRDSDRIGPLERGLRDCLRDGFAAPESRANVSLSDFGGEWRASFEHRRSAHGKCSRDHAKTFVHDAAALFVIARRLVPGVEPVHRAEQQRGQDSRLLAIKVFVAMRRVGLEQAAADARVLALEARDVGGVAAGERIRLAHEHLHLGEIAHVVLEMAADEEAQALFGVLGLRYSRFGERDELLERAPRDEVEQLFLVAQVVVDAREGNSRARRNVANRREAETLLGENRGSRSQNMIDVRVVALLGRHRARGRLDSRDALRRLFEIRLLQFITSTEAAAGCGIGNRNLELGQQIVDLFGELVAHLLVATASQTPSDVIELTLGSGPSEHIESGGVPLCEVFFQEFPSGVAFALKVPADQPVAKGGVAELLFVHALGDSRERLVAASDPFVSHVSALAVGEEAEQSVFEPVRGLITQLENIYRHWRGHEVAVHLNAEVFEQFHPVARVANFIGPERRVLGLVFGCGSQRKRLEECALGSEHIFGLDARLDQQHPDQKILIIGGEAVGAGEADVGRRWWIAHSIGLSCLDVLNDSSDIIGTGRGHPARDQPAIVRPPLTLSTWPVTKSESELAKNATAPARSAGCPRRRNGMPRAIDSRTFSRPAIALLSRAVSVGPGQTTFTLMWFAASSRASVFEKPMMAALHPA